jgi:hypothetical protein
MRTGWSRCSGAFGVTFGSANVAVEILLPDLAPVKNNTYRDSLIQRREEHRQVHVEEFAELVRVNRPQWLLDYIEEEASRNINQNGIMERLQSFLDQLKAMADQRPTVRDGGEEPGNKPPDAGDSDGNGQRESGGDENQQKPLRQKTGHGKRSASATPGVPYVRFTEDPAILEEIGGRAAVYKREDNCVLLNPKHFHYLKDLETIFQDAGPDSGRRPLPSSFSMKNTVLLLANLLFRPGFIAVGPNSPTRTSSEPSAWLV